MSWIRTNDQLPEDRQHVRTRDESGREFNCIYNQGRNEFSIAGYVWDHECVIEWTPINDAFNGDKNNWRGH